MQYLFGKKALADLINNQQKIEVVYLSADQIKIINQLQANQINYKSVSKSWFDQFDQTLNHQYIATKPLIQKQEKLTLDQWLKEIKHKETGLVLILDSIEDPRNFGAILRSADAFGVDAVFYKKNNQAKVNDLVIKTSMGAINYLNLFEVANLSMIIQKLKDHGFWVYATTLENSVSYETVDYAKKSCFVVGNENKGISQLIQKNSDININIPMYGSVQSLNVSVASGIILSNFRRVIKP